MIDFGESIRRWVQRESVSTKTGCASAPDLDEWKMRRTGIQMIGGGILG